MLRGQIWLYRADPTVGDEIGKTRPCVIVSNDDEETIQELGQALAIVLNI
jgi:transcriptional modulator of MazE/toxin, MazF